ncbi:MAG: hypothetical protein IJT31_06535 [Oscillibacter sp.]|nr:hypothetical protein [Oscillibacter sp.]
MYDNTTADALDDVLDQYALPRELRGLFLGYLRLSDSAKAELRGMLLQWAEDAAPVQPTREEPAESEEPEELFLTPRETPLTPEDIEKRVRAYRALLERERSLKLALGYGTPPQALASGDSSNRGGGEPGSSGNDIS